MYVRNRTVEITRLSDLNDWYYTESKNMIADLGTRKGATIEQVGPDSHWNNGLPWMKESPDNFPLRKIEDIILSAKAKTDAAKEKNYT